MAAPPPLDHCVFSKLEQTPQGCQTLCLQYSTGTRAARAQTKTFKLMTSTKQHLFSLISFHWTITHRVSSHYLWVW